ncbi:MAG TPA: serine protease [Vicinamibacterales bacterium]|nr:serine protease [Vicinamibacterales bacterium]
MNSLLTLLLVLLPVARPLPPSAHSPARQTAPLHVLKIAAGPSGVEEKGEFKLAEERTVFSRTEHREVIVFFQWEGAPGVHKLEATWRSPAGATMTSALDYTARGRRFGAYWRMPMTPTTALGTWSIEATVERQPAGRFTFDVIDATPPPAAPAAAVKRPLSQQELYERLARAFVVVTRTLGSGRVLEPTGAVIGGEGQLFTAARGLDEAERLQAVAAGGTAHDLAQVIAFDRAGGWAILAAPTAPAALLPRAAGTLQIGDRCYSMHGSPGGARVLIEGQVTGKTDEKAGRFMVSFFNGAGTSGSPVVNEHGELVGMLALNAMPDLRAIRLTGGTVEFGNIPMIPIAEIAPRAGAVPSTLESLRARGDLLLPLTGETHVVSGGFATSINRGPIVRPDDQRQEFSAKTDKEVVIFVTWSPRERLKGQTAFNVYDAAGQLVATSKPAKIDFRKSDLVMSSWRIPLFQAPGTYRAEIHLNGKPAWRDYVRVVR